MTEEQKTPSAKRRARRGRTARQSAIADKPVAPAYITRKIPYYAFLDDDALARIEDQADWLIQEIGMEFREDETALQLWRDAGADVKDSRVRAPRGLVRKLCESAPEEFEQVARNRAKSVRIGGNSQVFAPCAGPPFVRDLQGGRRYGNIADFEKLIKLTQVLPSLHHTGWHTCEPCDIPVSKRHFDMQLAHMLYTDKPHLGAITEMSRCQDSVDMARIMHGDDFVDKHCVIMGNVNTNSPLLIDKVVTEAVRVYSGANQGIVAVPFILSGAMGPVTTAASVAQALAEAMMVCAFSQLVRPGSPFVLGNFLSSMSLRSGAPTFGMPEPVMSNLAVGQLARRLGVPLRCGGSLTASKIEDAQAAAESADSMFSTMLGGAHYILHAAGWLEGGLCTGFEKLIIDADRLASYQVFLNGMNTDDNQLGRNAYSDVEPAGHFMGSQHTLANYQTAFFESSVSDHDNVESWEEKGSEDARQRAYKRWNQLLDEYEKPPVDDAVEEALHAFVARRKEELPDLWH